MTLRESIVAVVLFLLLIPLPKLATVYACAFSMHDDPTLAAVLDVRSGLFTEDDLAALESAKEKEPDQDVLLSLALIHYKEGRFRTASTFLKEALKKNQHLDVVYNNLGCLYLAAADPEHAIESFQRAVNTDPEELLPVYNLSQAYNEVLDIQKSKDLFSKAQEMNSTLADDFSEMRAPGRVNRTVISMPVPLESILKRVFAASERKYSLRDAWWRSMVGWVPVSLFPSLMVVLAVLAGISAALGRKLGLSRPCAMCGSPVCRRCQHMSRDPSLCSPCYHAFREHRGIDPRVVVERRAAVRRLQDIRRTVGLVATVIAPGAGHLFQGATIRGSIGLFISGLFIWSVVAWRIIWPRLTFGIQEGLSLSWVALLLCYIIILVLFLWDYISHSENWG